MKKGFKSGFGGLFFVMLVIALPAKSQGIPVIDATSIYNLGLQLTTLKEQFDNMQANTRTPETYLWAEVQQSMNQLIQLSNAINMIRGQYGGVDQILSRFQNYAYYRVSPCISAQAVCDDAAWKSILQGQLASTDIQKRPMMRSCVVLIIKKIKYHWMHSIYKYCKRKLVLQQDAWKPFSMPINWQRTRQINYCNCAN